MLKTDPTERFTIDDVIRNKWVDVSVKTNEFPHEIQMYNILFLFSPAIHGGAADPPADLPGPEGGERAVAGGAAGDVAGAKGDEGRQRPGI